MEQKDAEPTWDVVIDPRWVDEDVGIPDSRRGLNPDDVVEFIKELFSSNE